MTSDILCFIPSKNRPNTTTYKLFEAVGIKTFHFLEPQCINSYNVPNKINILHNDNGVSYVRNFMLDYAKQLNLKWVIFCDDDVSAFGILVNGKTIKSDASIWLNIIEKAAKTPFEIVGINYCQYAWLAKHQYSINSKFAEVCIAMDVSKINWKYDTNIKEDRDFQLQTIKNGNGVISFETCWFQCPAVGTNKGGLQDMYKLKKDNDWAKKLVFKYHPFAKLIRKGDRIDARVDIKSFAKFYKKNVYGSNSIKTN